MSSEWPLIKLNELCLKITDGAHQSPKSVTTGKPMASVKDLTRFGVDLSNARLISEEDFTVLVKQGCKPEVGDVLIAKDGNSALDTVCSVDAELNAVLLSSVAILRPDKSKILTSYLKHYLYSVDVIDYLKSNFISGAAIPRVVLKDFKKADIRVPPLPEQEAIASVLEALDSRIKVLRETNTTLEVIAQALFKSWFVDFDPVRAKAEGRQPEGMDAATAALFPNSFAESELGLVPKGWAVKPVGDAVDCLGGGTPDTKESSYWEPAEHCWTTPKDLSGLQSPVLLRTERQLSTLGLAKVSSGLLPAGTLLLSSRAPIGYLAIAQMPVAVNQGYIAIPPGGELSPVYMLFWCRQNMEGIKGRANGSTFMEISKKAFRPIPVLVPTAEVLDAFANIADPLFERLIENERQAQTLAQLRDTLLPRLISGQLRLPEAEALLENNL